MLQKKTENLATALLAYRWVHRAENLNILPSHWIGRWKCRTWKCRTRESRI